MARSQLILDSAVSATLSTTAIIPVLNGATTGTGDATAGQVVLSDLATFFAANAGPVSTTSVTFTLKVSSATALATPSALAATAGQFFASTVSGATLMGFGTTGDVTLKNRAGTDVIVVTSNTTGVTMAGALAITGALSGVTTLATSSTINSQTISATAAFTGTVSVATTLTVTSGNLLIGGSVGATAAKVIALSNSATSPSTSTDLCHLYSLDISAGHASLAIWSEEVVNAGIAVASTHRLPITINGTQYAVLLTTVLA